MADQLAAGLLGTALGTLLGAVLSPLSRLADRVLAARLTFSFEQGPNGTSRTPVLLHHNGKVVGKTDAYYIRARLENKAWALAKQCRVYLVSIEQIESVSGGERYVPTVFCDSVQLKWAVREHAPFEAVDLPRGVAQYVDVLSTRADKPDMELAVGSWPLRYRELLQQPGTYRLRLCVGGDNVHPVILALRLKWTGVWEDIEVSQIRD